MRISDWSSDVCSSDLIFLEHQRLAVVGQRRVEMRKLRHRLRERPDEEDQRRDPRIAGQRPAVRVERGDVDLVMMGDVGNLRPALRQAARDDPLKLLVGTASTAPKAANWASGEVSVISSSRWLGS